MTMNEEEGIPRFQLKKFSDGLKASDQQAQRNYHQLNVNRVGDFIKKNSLNSKVRTNRREYNVADDTIVHYAPSVPVVLSLIHI